MESETLLGQENEVVGMQQALGLDLEDRRIQ